VNNTITVIGSYSVGMFFKGHALPNPGETVNGYEFFEGPGGKGSNQLITSAVMGANTKFVARIGNDRYGTDALNMYKKYGIPTDLIKIDETAGTSVGAILIDSEGRNLINIVSGANGNLSTEDIDSALPHVKDSFIVGFQLENPVDTVMYGIKNLAESGIRTLLDPAPATVLPEDIYSSIYYLKPNEHEAKILSGIEVVNTDTAKEACQWFKDKGVNTVIITLGEQGSVIMDSDGCRSLQAMKVNTVDTTGAGDIFSGSMMAMLAKGMYIDEAVRFASAAAALSVTRFGVVDAIPAYIEVVDFLKNYKG